MTHLKYPCPDCGTTNRVHGVDCETEHAFPQIEKAYMDIISVLLERGKVKRLDGKPPGISYKKLTTRVTDELTPDDTDDEESDSEPDYAALKTVSSTVEDDEPDDEDDDDAIQSWVDLHDDCLHYLKRLNRVAEDSAMGGIYLTKPEEQDSKIVPLFDPMRTVFEYGPVDGCKDIAVFTMISWCELKDLSWTGAKAFMEWWLTETDRWETESWGESSIDELCENKKHVYEEEMGWGDHPTDAKNKMESISKSPAIDAPKLADNIGRSDFE